MNRYLSEDLRLLKTKVNDGKSVNVSNFWAWNKGNPYIPAGALVSSITDMMKYAQMQMDGNPAYVIQSHAKLAEVDPHIALLGDVYDFKAHSMGLGWMIDTDHNILHHGGNTGYSNSFLGFDKTNRISVVVLVNMPGPQSCMIGSAIFRELQEIK
jgi:CubicO group peptidase (beta-lactamase class C family)